MHLQYIHLKNTFVLYKRTEGVVLMHFNFGLLAKLLAGIVGGIILGSLGSWFGFQDAVAYEGLFVYFQHLHPYSALFYHSSFLYLSFLS